jgi:TRAP-type transport system periplasmic protein
MKRFIPLALASIAAVTIPVSVAFAQSTELRYASSSPPNTVWAMQTERLTKMVSEKSGGTLKINAFINSQLGSEQDTIQQVARGRIDMGGYSITAGSLLVPELALVNMPFLFKSSAEQDCVFDNHLTKIATDLFARKGVQFIGWSHVGETNIIGKKPFLKPEDLKGLKARAQPTKLGPYLWTTFGANPNPLPVTEWNAAHQSGLVEVADAPVTFYVFAGLGKVAPVMTLTKHLDHGGVVIMNKAVYDKLPEASRKAMTDVEKEAPASLQRKEVREFEAKLAGMHKSQGGTIVELTPEQREVWRKEMTNAWPKMVEAIGGESNAMYQAIQDGIKACSK